MSSYTANIEVIRITTQKRTPSELRQLGLPTDTPPQRVKQSFRVTVKSDSLQKLKEKVIAHMQLVDTDDVRGEDGNDEEFI